MIQITDTVTKKTAFPMSAVSRIAKVNGAERIGRDAIEAIALKTEEYAGMLSKKSVEMATHAGRKTLKAEDVAIAAGSL